MWRCKLELLVFILADPSLVCLPLCYHRLMAPKQCGGAVNSTLCPNPDTANQCVCRNVNLVSELQFFLECWSLVQRKGSWVPVKAGSGASWPSCKEIQPPAALTNFWQISKKASFFFFDLNAISHVLEPPWHKVCFPWIIWSCTLFPLKSNASRECSQHPTLALPLRRLTLLCFCSSTSLAKPMTSRCSSLSDR